MCSLLLAIIYLAFISLGLPDSILGSGWPVMHGDLGVPLSYAGIVTMIISVGTIISSLSSDYMTKKLTPGRVTAISVGMTALALFGFSVSGAFWQICLWSIPYGLGAGAVDAALNNYVALHYSSRHMSWLHGFWGVGVSISPYIMSFSLSNQLGWNVGYRIVSIIQIVLTAILFLSLPLWKRTENVEGDMNDEPVCSKDALKIKGVKYCLILFFGFCAFESTAGIWAASYLVKARGVDAELAAAFASLFYLGETVGRFVNGFIADRFGDKKMINLGICVIIAGVIMIILPFGRNDFALLGLVVIGLGAAPVYPCIIHSTPANFGEENSQALVGVQMASAYVGTTLASPVFGFLADNISVSLYPFYLAIFAVLMMVMTWKMNKVLRG